MTLRLRRETLGAQSLDFVNSRRGCEHVATRFALFTPFQFFRQDLIQPLCSRSGDGRLPPCTYAHQTTVRMRHTCSLEGASLGYINSAVTLAARDDAEVPITSAVSRRLELRCRVEELY